MCAALAALAATGAANGQCPVARLFAPDGAPTDYFGYDVSISGDTAIVSADWVDTPAGANAGSAFIFVRSGAGWAQQAQLFANPPGAGDQFGYSAAIDGDTAVVGADWDDTPAGSNAGSVWVFGRSGSVWTQRARLLAPDALPNDILGVSVAISGNTIIAGAPGDDTPAGTNAGSAYVWVRDPNGAWTYRQHLFASDAAAGDFFSGFSIDIDGDTAVIGAINDDTPAGTNAGSVYVFVRDPNGVWTEQAHLFPSQGAPYHGFGESADISGDTIIVGSSGPYPPDGTYVGDAYVFVRQNGVWTEQQRLVSPNPAPGETFGWSVAVEGDTAVIGAPWDVRGGVGTKVGSAYVFRRSGGVWTCTAQLHPAGGAPGAIFGFAAAISGERAIVAADWDDTPVAADAGAAYVFDLGCIPCPGDADIDGDVDQDDLDIVLFYFGQAVPLATNGDVDADGDVDQDDLDLVLFNFGTSCR